jgi:hypothetical protein
MEYDIHFDEKKERARKRISEQYQYPLVNESILMDIIRLSIITSTIVDEEHGYRKIKFPNFPAWCCQKCGEPIGYLGRFMEWTHFADLLLSRHKCRG